MLLLLLLLAVLAGPAMAQAAPPCSLPAANALGRLDPSPEPSWTLQEKWIWEQTLAGEVADLDWLYCRELGPEADDAAWRDPAQPRRVSERFLLDVLATKRFAEAVPHRGLRINGAWFPDPLDLSRLEIARDLWLDGSRLDGPVWFGFARLESSLSFEGSTFADTVNMDGLAVGGGLFLRGGATFKGGVRLRGARSRGSSTRAARPSWARWTWTASRSGRACS